jgi:hypothetical protein
MLERMHDVSPGGGVSEKRESPDTHQTFVHLDSLLESSLVDIEVTLTRNSSGEMSGQSLLMDWKFPRSHPCSPSHFRSREGYISVNYDGIRCSVSDIAVMDLVRKTERIVT